MTEKKNIKYGTGFLFTTAAFVVIIWGIYQAQSFLVLMLVALFLAVIGAPPVLWLKKKRVPVGLAVLIVLAGMIAMLLIIGGVVGTSLAGFSSSLPLYQNRIAEEIQTLKVFMASNGFAMKDGALLDYVNPGAVMSLTAGLLSGLTSTLSSVFLILLTVTFTLLEITSFPAKIRKILNDPNADFSQLRKFIQDINHYMVIKTGVSAFTGIMIGIWMSFLGVDFPVLWGFLAFLFNYIPSLGIIIAAFPAVPAYVYPIRTRICPACCCRLYRDQFHHRHFCRTETCRTECRLIDVGCVPFACFLGKSAGPDRYGFVCAVYHDSEICVGE